MKLRVLLVVVGLSGIAASVGMLQSSHASAADLAQTSYYANGQLQSETEVRDGQRHGLARRWYADGKLMAEGRYVDGRMEGRWEWWHSDGRADLERTGSYADGERQPE